MKHSNARSLDALAPAMSAVINTRTGFGAGVRGTSRLKSLGKGGKVTPYTVNASKKLRSAAAA